MNNKHVVPWGGQTFILDLQCHQGTIKYEQTVCSEHSACCESSSHGIDWSGSLPRTALSCLLAVLLPPTLPHPASPWPQEFGASHFRVPSSSYKPQDLSELVTFVWLWPLHLILATLLEDSVYHSREGLPQQNNPHHAGPPKGGHLPSAHFLLWLHQIPTRSCPQ